MFSSLSEFMKCSKKEENLNKKRKLVKEVALVLTLQIPKQFSTYLKVIFLPSIKNYLTLKCNGSTFMGLLQMLQINNIKISINFSLI